MSDQVKVSSTSGGVGVDGAVVVADAGGGRTVSTSKKLALWWSVFAVGWLANQVAAPLIRTFPVELSTGWRWAAVWLTLGGLVFLIPGAAMGLVYWNRLLKEWRS